MLAKTSLRNTINWREDKHRHGDEKPTTTTPTHDMRAAEPTFSHSELAGTGLAEAKVASKTGFVYGDEKPSWEEVMQSTTNVSSLLAQVDGDLMIASDKKRDGRDDSSMNTRPSDKNEYGPVSVLQIDALQKSMNEMKTEMHEAVNVASAMQQSRLDDLDASLDAKFEQMMKRLEKMMERVGSEPAGRTTLSTT